MYTQIDNNDRLFRHALGVLGALGYYSTLNKH